MISNYTNKSPLWIFKSVMYIESFITTNNNAGAHRSSSIQGYFPKFNLRFPLTVYITGGPGCGVQVVSAGYLGQGGPDVCTEGPGHVGQRVCVEDRVQGGQVIHV